jgi:hypothetical protein
LHSEDLRASLYFIPLALAKKFNVLYPRRHLYLYNTLENIFFKDNFLNAFESSRLEGFRV